MSAPLTAKIGIVSAQKHCKAHLDGLRSDGLDVVCLGDKVNDIPDTIGIVLVRVASSSHSAVSVARMWGKDTGRPVIYENGLTGMRRALSGLVQTDSSASLPDSTSPEIGERLEYLIDAGKLLLTYQQDLSVDALTEHLIKVFWEKYPKGPRSLVYLASTAATMILPPGMDSPTDNEREEDCVSNGKTNPPLGLPVQERPFPGSSETWSRKITPKKLEAAYKYASNVLQSVCSDEDRIYYGKTWAKAEKTNTLPRRAERFFRATFSRKPLEYVMFVFLLTERVPLRPALVATYTQATRKQPAHYLDDAVCWYLGREQDAVPAVTSQGVSEVDSNTQAILEVMEDLAALKKEVRDRESKVKDLSRALGVMDEFSDLKSRVEALEEDNEDPSWEDRHDLLLTALGEVQSRVTALKRAGVVESEGEAEWEERFAQMKEDLRADISNAFDAAAAEQQAVSKLSGNPFAALEQVKAALKAAGFKGTLTLTIE